MAKDAKERFSSPEAREEYPRDRDPAAEATPAKAPPQTPAPGGDQERHPKFETPAPVDPNGPVLRVVRPIERVPIDLRPSLKRYKIRCTNYEGDVLYVLAGSEEDARAHYLKTQRIDELVKGLEADGVEKVATPRLSVRVLED
jgi:hypothetical protein